MWSFSNDISILASIRLHTSGRIPMLAFKETNYQQISGDPSKMMIIRSLAFLSVIFIGFSNAVSFVRER